MLAKNVFLGVILSGLSLADDAKLKLVVIDLRGAHFCDVIDIDALGRVVLRIRHHGVPIEIIGMNEARQTLADKLALHEKPGVALTAGGH